MKAVGHLFIASALFLSACGGAEDVIDQHFDGDGHWSTLVATDVTIDSGEQSAQCVRLTVDEELFIQALHVVSSAGIEHATLTFGEPTGPDGVGACEAVTDQDTLIYSASASSQPLRFPEGVAVQVPAGSQLLLRVDVHGDQQQVPGTTEVRAETIAPSRVSDVAEAIAVRPSGMLIPPGPSATTGGCTLRHDGFLFAAGPHLPEMGSDMQLIAHSSFSGHVTLLDTTHDSAAAHIARLDHQVPMRAGETVEIRCERHNATSEIVTEDTSRMHGMCYGNVYRYPAQSDGFLCAD